MAGLGSLGAPCSQQWAGATSHRLCSADLEANLCLGTVTRLWWLSWFSCYGRGPLWTMGGRVLKRSGCLLLQASGLCCLPV